MNSYRIPLALIGLCVSVAARPVDADDLTFSTSFQTPLLTASTPAWQSFVNLPRFDPNLGYLESVSIEIHATMTGQLGVENTSATATTSNTHVRAYVSSTSYAGQVSTVPWFLDLVSAPTLPPFDGALDFGGASGTTASFVQLADAPGTNTQTLASSVNQFRGPAGAPGTVAISVYASRNLQTIPESPTLAATSELAVDGTLTLTYHYTTATTRICSGDPQVGWGNCPCGWGGGPSCGNSVNTLGAAMAANGVGAVANDTIAFQTFGLPNSSAIFLQGDQLTTQTTFGDGLRCVDGNLIRLGTAVIQGGQAGYPGPGQLPVSVRGQVVAPCTRYYQTYYRNAANYCTPGTSNLSDGIALYWTP
ncbi:MAG: choice-of-anchor E domain-containing protein [Planctomycetes bacterium]|nr:choice-of-anchor E domain-containing protein [Planctomycetota bacterium]